MFDISIDEKYIVTQEGTSEGTQIKYKKDGYWYKLDSKGNEGLCEYLVSKLLTFSRLDENEFVLYEQGFINGKKGCRSKDFIKNEDEELITLYRLYHNETGHNLAEVLGKFDNVGKRIEYTVDFVKKSTGYDISDYFKKIFTLDRITLNDDRHVNNLALLGTNKGFKAAPVFDNGKSLLTANVSYNKNFSMEENVKRVIARPFSGSHQEMFDYFGEGFKLDKDNALKWLETEPASLERNVLIYQIKRYYE
ncbi:MAG: hypothetical protein IJT72_03605 [Lachnospiraceae bacterium]|nr:hypothetical protein [Lachnospiraceae bacterium]